MSMVDLLSTQLCLISGATTISSRTLSIVKISSLDSLRTWLLLYTTFEYMMSPASFGSMPFPINQYNDVEKGEHVRYMLEIYKKSKSVVVWLGATIALDVPRISIPAQNFRLGALPKRTCELQSQF